MSTVDRLHREAPLTDLHAHPSLKAFLFNRNLWHHYKSGSAFNPFASRSDFKKLREGGVRVLWAGHYLPERELFRDCFLMRAAAFLLTPAYFKLTTRTYWERLNEMMDALEEEVDRKPDRIEMARSVADLDRIRQADKIAIIHAVEGAHVLEGDAGRVAELAERGVVMITLNHFYPNGVGSRVNALPAEMAISKLCTFKFEAGEPPVLTPYGRDLIRELASNRMMVDITHCWPDTRAEIFSEINRERPIVASHVGVRALFDDPYNLSDEEIREIGASGGVMGVILMPHWLATNDKAGVDQVVDTMEHIATVSGSWDHVAIGTDFDGFTEPPEDIPDASHLHEITRTLLARGISEDNVKKALGGNADRVLRAAWT